MACYVRIGDKVDTEEVVEVPTEDDGTLLLSSVSAQFPGTVGLRYKTSHGTFRGCRVDGNIIDPPLEGWGDSEYFVIIKKASLKRGVDDDNEEKPHVGPGLKLNKVIEEVPDLMVGGLPFSATEDDVREYFEKFGDLVWCEVKFDKDGKSKGYGFLRFKTAESAKAAFRDIHVLHNRRIDLHYSKRYLQQKEEDNVVTKLFVGRLPPGTTTGDLLEHFRGYGVLKDIYIPNPFKGYGFVSFASKSIANQVMNDTHVLKGHFLNIGTPTQKKLDGEHNAGLSGTQGGSGLGTQSDGSQMGNKQSLLPSGGANSQSWMQGKMQSQNMGQNTGPRFGYGYLENGNYSSYGLYQNGAGKLGQNAKT